MAGRIAEGEAIQMTYYHIKIGKGNREADRWLGGRSPLDRPAAVIYFDDLPEEEYENGGGTPRARDFWLCGRNPQRQKSAFVLIRAGEVWFLRPAGPVRFLPTVRHGRRRILPKAMPVEILKKVSTKEVPFVLATMPTNRFLSSGTFRKIGHPGNLRAIDVVLGNPQRGPLWEGDRGEPERLIQCLASVEFETLVARIFEAAGCHVPAYRGGCIQDIDIVARNPTGRTLSLGGVHIRPRESLSCQVKLQLKGERRPEGADVVVCGERSGDGVLGADWVLDRVLEAPPVREWLRRSLAWLPESFRAVYGLGK